LNNKLSDFDKLHALLKERSFRFGEFILSSGKKSTYYFDGKQVTLSPQGAYLTAKVILEKIKRDHIQAAGGPTLGADPMVGALATVAFLNNFDLKVFIVRKSPKEHGTKKYIEGPELYPGERIAVVEDVMTTGSSIIKAIDVLQEIGCHVVKVIPLVDRLEGGTEKVRNMGIDVDPVFTIKDFGL
jgi:orotate phosphoribosyltransferase